MVRGRHSSVDTPAVGMGYTSVGLQHSRSAVLHAQVPPHYRPVMPHNAALLNSQSSGNVPQAVPPHYRPVMPHNAALLNSQSSGNVPQAPWYTSVGLQHSRSAVLHAQVPPHYRPVMPHNAALLNSQSSGNVPQAPWYTSVGLQHSRSAVLHAQVPPHYRPVMPHNAALLNSQSSGNVPQAVPPHYRPVMPHNAALINSQSSGNVPQAVSSSPVVAALVHERRAAALPLSSAARSGAAALPARDPWYTSVGLQHSRSAVLHAQVPPHYRPVMPHNAALLNSQSSGNVPQAPWYTSVGLQHSRSAVLHAQVPPHYRPVMPHNAALLNSQSSGNVPQASGPRVHFKLQPQTAIIPEKKKSPPSSLTNGNGKSIRPQAFTPGLKRSKSLTSADTLASGMAALGLAADAGDLGSFPPDIQECIDKALEDPNAVSARTLMDAVGHLVSRAVESPRYALPAARRCISVVEHELTETFLESLLNTCQQWYHDRERLLGAVVGGGRPRLMAFLSFLLEMYCQLRRRAIQRRGGASAQPGQVLLTLICKCCEDCIRQAVPSPSDVSTMMTSSYCTCTAIQRRGGASAQPGQVLLTLICKCCEDCIRQAVPSPSDQQPGQVLLTLICKCCEDCIRQAVPSPSDHDDQLLLYCQQQPGQVLLTLICKCCEDCIRQAVPSPSDVTAARAGAADAHLQVLRGLHPPGRALAQRREYHDDQLLLYCQQQPGQVLLTLICKCCEDCIRQAVPSPSDHDDQLLLYCQQQPGQVLLTLICKCCEDCIRQAVPSPSDTENLFFVLTYIGRDLESQLPGELERLLSAVRDAFLQPAAPPSIRRTLLQLIELHASRWQLPGQAVLYYYPSSK
ncbi:hypothetical protein NE865_11505 [Phthorimaea operculella]|nr:hypothetical protein NE865_11505 [Phthorimaea operculella]